jgi:hypothetical protein
MPDEDEEWLDEISIGLDPEDGVSAYSASAKNRQPFARFGVK